MTTDLYRLEMKGELLVFVTSRTPERLHALENARRRATIRSPISNGRPRNRSPSMMRPPNAYLANRTLPSGQQLTRLARRQSVR
jgi:hypothetical protein